MKSTQLLKSIGIVVIITAIISLIKSIDEEASTNLYSQNGLRNLEDEATRDQIERSIRG